MKIWLCFLALVSLIFVVKEIRKSKRRLDEVKGHNFYLKLKSLELDYEKMRIRGEFKKYPNTDKHFREMLALIAGKDTLDLRNIRLVKPKIRGFLNYAVSDEVEAYMNERAKWKNDEIRQLDDNILKVRNEILLYKFPIRGRLYRWLFPLKVQILLNVLIALLPLIKKIDSLKGHASQINEAEEAWDGIKDDDFPLDGALILNNS